VAHALTRHALSLLCPPVPATAWRFTEIGNHKPLAWGRDGPAPVSFNLSHTNGMVGVAALAQPDVAVGFDIEALDRRVDLRVASRYFRSEEIDWLNRLPESQRTDGFLRLWTLKEAFIKATGEGLARALDSFWFAMHPPRLRFAARSEESASSWHFEQRVIAGRFIAAVGVHGTERPPRIRWQEVAADSRDGHPLLRETP
jgi:4'-phosphopantetheinyl transferase